MKNEERVCLTIDLRGGDAIYLRTLKEFGFNMTKFIRDAVKYYIPHFKEKMEVLLKYNKAIKKQQKGINED